MDGDRSTEHTVTVLGDVTLDGQRLTPAQGALVSALVLHHPTPTTTEALIDLVWDDTAPGTARQSVQNQIFRLRQRFGTEVVATTPSGYRLRAVSDASAFEAALPGSDETTQNASPPDRLEAALALWRGLPYRRLNHPAADGERARLLDLHGSASERLAAERIAEGRFDRAIVELTALCRSHPFREHLWGLLMVALTEVGRRVEALATFNRLTRLLDAELDIRPSARLRRLRSAIDRDEPLGLIEFVDHVGPNRGRGPSWTTRPLAVNRRVAVPTG